MQTQRVCDNTMQIYDYYYPSLCLEIGNKDFNGVNDAFDMFTMREFGDI